MSSWAGAGGPQQALEQLLPPGLEDSVPSLGLSVPAAQKVELHVVRSIFPLELDPLRRCNPDTRDVWGTSTIPAPCTCRVRLVLRLHQVPRAGPPPQVRTPCHPLLARCAAQPAQGALAPGLGGPSPSPWPCGCPLPWTSCPQAWSQPQVCQSARAQGPQRPQTQQLGKGVEGCNPSGQSGVPKTEGLWGGRDEEEDRTGWPAPRAPPRSANLLAAP